MNRIKLLVVYDSMLFREVIARYINQDDLIEIVGKAGDAYSARDMILQYQPDVMTLDLEMPKIDGISFKAFYKNQSGDGEFFRGALSGNSQSL